MLTSMAPRRRWAGKHAVRLAGILVGVAVVGCGPASASLDCGQIPDRAECERVAEFATAATDTAATSVHVQSRTCDRYLDPVPADARCWSVRFDEAEVIGVVQVDGKLRLAEGVFPIFP